MSKAYEFLDTKGLIGYLKQNKMKLAKYFNDKYSFEDIVRSSYGVGNNTFRAFHHMPKRPSQVFRQWASKQLNNKSTIKKIVSVSSEQEYDHWLGEFSESLNQYWKKNMGVVIPYGPRRKLPNLLMKTLVLWDGIEDSQRERLMRFLHVPLDSYILAAIRNCISEFSDFKIIGVIPRNATMRFVTNEAMYNGIQQIIRNIARRAGIPSIYLDALWNVQH